MKPHSSLEFSRKERLSGTSVTLLGTSDPSSSTVGGLRVVTFGGGKSPISSTGVPSNDTSSAEQTRHDALTQNVVMTWKITQAFQ